MITRHAYGPHRHQYTELHLPDGAGPFPVAVVVHGGFWLAEHGLHRMDAVCDDLVARGFAAYNVEYRRLGEGSDGGWPQTPQDVSAAIDALADLDAPLDLARVVSIGHSAGGHLTLLDAARGAGARVRVSATIAQAALTDVRRAHGRPGGSDQVVEWFMGGPPSDAYDDASPISRLPLGVPQLVIHGDQDELVPVAWAREYAAAAEAAGDVVTYTELPGGGHFDHQEPDSAAWAAAVAWLTARTAG